MDFEEQVESVTVILRGWLQNLSRNAAGEGLTLEPAVVAESLDNLRQEYDALIKSNVDDIDEYLRDWSEEE